MRVAAQSRSSSEAQSAEDDGRAVAAELQGAVLARHAVHDRVADLVGAGEGDDRQALVLDQGGHPVVRRPAGRDQEPAGRSVSASSSPRISPDSGVAGAGLRMIGAPTAMAGAILWAHRFSGKLNGAMPRTTPFGKRRVSASRPVPPASVSRRWASPPLKRRASSAAKRKTDTARPTSPRAHLIGLPFSAEISWAISSVRSTSRCDTWSRAAARTWAGVAANSSRTAYAAATASSTCASVGTLTCRRAGRPTGR